MFKKILQIKLDYDKAKTEAIEQTVNDLESKTELLYTIIFVSLLIIFWLYAILTPVSFIVFFSEVGLFYFGLFFIVSYFSLYWISKYIFRPSIEEIEDDTSIFAVFSACERKANRCFASIGLSIMQTGIFVLYFLNKDLRIF